MSRNHYPSLEVKCVGETHALILHIDSEMLSDMPGEESHVVVESLWTSLFLIVHTKIRAVAISRSSGTRRLKIE